MVQKTKEVGLASNASFDSQRVCGPSQGRRKLVAHFSLKLLISDDTLTTTVQDTKTEEMTTSVGNVADSTGWLPLFRRTNGTLLTRALSAVTILVRRDAVELVWNVNVTLIKTSKVIVLDFQLCI